MLKKDNYDGGSVTFCWLYRQTCTMHIAQLTLLTVPSPCIAFYWGSFIVLKEG